MHYDLRNHRESDPVRGLALAILISAFVVVAIIAAVAA